MRASGRVYCHIGSFPKAIANFVRYILTSMKNQALYKQRYVAFALTLSIGTGLAEVAISNHTGNAHADSAQTTQQTPRTPKGAGSPSDPNYIPQAPNVFPTPLPSNPLVIDDLNNSTGNATTYYNQAGTIAKPFLFARNGAINPDANTLFTDPGLRERDVKTPQLPLFGYDFFSATRQIITARRLYFERQFQPPRQMANAAYPGGRGAPYTAQNPGMSMGTPQGYTGQPGYNTQVQTGAQYGAANSVNGAGQPYAPNGQPGYADQSAAGMQSGYGAQPNMAWQNGYSTQPYTGQTQATNNTPYLPNSMGNFGNQGMQYSATGTVNPDIAQSKNAAAGQTNQSSSSWIPNQAFLPAMAPSTYQPDVTHTDRVIPSLDPYYYQTQPVIQQQPASSTTRSTNEIIVQPSLGGQTPYSAYSVNQGQGAYGNQQMYPSSSNYPNQQMYANPSNYPGQQMSSGYPSIDQQMNPNSSPYYPNIEQQSYPNSSNYPNPQMYQNSSNYPNQQMSSGYPNQQTGQNSSNYPSPQMSSNASNYPMQTSNSGLSSSQTQTTYPNPATYQLPNQYPVLPTTPQFEGMPSQIDAYHDVADPITQLFRNVQQSLPANYQLNPGDTITLRIWSPTIPMREFTSKIDSRGMIYLTDTGPQVVRGLTTAQAEDQLRQKLRRIYRSVDVSITMSELRTMTVTVTGEAFAPGTYSVPAGTSAFNLLYAAGGPTLNGSLRNIEVRRHGDIAGKIDLYGFILGDGDKADMTLEPGDIIYVPGRYARVSVHGEVRHEAIFEVRNDETIEDVLKFAGGVKPSGVAQRIELHTFQPGQSRLIKDIDFTDHSAQRMTPVYDGDDVDIFSIRDEIVNRVTVEGAVDQPGDYALAPGMHLSDLIKRARGTVEDAYTTRADLYRWNVDNTLTLVPVSIDKALEHDPQSDISLMRWDRLHVYSRDQVQWTGRRQVVVRGAVQRPGTYYRSENMYVKDILMQAGGTLPEAYLNRAALLHQHPDGSFTYEDVNIAEALKDGGNPGPKIQDDDILAVYKIGEAQFTPDHTVTIRGRVNTPGIYPRGEGMHLSNLLQLAGGFVPGAGSTVAITHPARVTDIATSVQHTITVSLDRDHNFPVDQDLVLQDGDVVTVQGIGGVYTAVRVITVAGAVKHPGPIPMTPEMRASDAIAAAGGFLPQAYPKGAEFLRNPTYMTTQTQATIAGTIEHLIDLLNASDFQRQLAKSDIERLQAIQGGNSTVVGGAGITSLLGATSSSSAPLPADATASLQKRDLVSLPRILNARDLTPNGNIAINLASAMDRPGGHDDLPLMDGDMITVPERPTTIQVVGAVFNSRGVLFKPGQRIDYYINQAGGLAPDAARDHIEIIHIGGGLIPADGHYTLEPGDVILVPNKVLAASIASRRSAWSETLSQITNVGILAYVLAKLL